MMKNYGQSVEIIHNPIWLYIPDHPHRIFIIGHSGSCKTNALLNLIRLDVDIDKIYLSSKIHMDQSIECLLKEEKVLKIRLKAIKKPKCLH